MDSDGAPVPAPTRPAPAGRWPTDAAARPPETPSAGALHQLDGQAARMPDPHGPVPPQRGQPGVVPRPGDDMVLYGHRDDPHPSGPGEAGLRVGALPGPEPADLRGRPVQVDVLGPGGVGAQVIV